MTRPAVSVAGLTKVFRSYRRQEGLVEDGGSCATR
jgi:hypothetical protein